MASRIVPQSTVLSFPKTRAPKKADYLRFIRLLPCCISGVMGVEAAHVSYADPWYGSYGRGKGSKVSDRFAVPLSSGLHALQHSGKHGSEQSFWTDHGVQPHCLANTLFGLFHDYDEMDALQFATARIMQGLPK